MSEEMLEEGFDKIISVDQSSTVIRFMTDKSRNKKESFIYQQMDINKLLFPEAHFEVIIDKCTLDCVFCGENSL
jgi:2-polyprenyl-3-methyl-5-hydroxy-6-metoxy-1,4-benzoquinol methylase